MGFVIPQAHYTSDCKVKRTCSGRPPHWASNVASSYKRRHRDVGLLRWIGFCKQVFFNLFPEGGKKVYIAYVIR